MMPSDAARTAATDEGPVGLTVENAAVGGPDILISLDPRWGTLRLRLRNNSQTSLTLSPLSTLRLYFVPLLTGDEVAGITVRGTGWTGGAVQDAQGKHLEMHPAAPVPTWPAGGTIEIELDKVLASGAATTGYMRFEYSGFGGVADGGRRMKVFRQGPPNWPNEWPVRFGLGSREEYGGAANTIYVTPWPVPQGSTGVENEILLQIYNDGSDAIALPGDGAPRFVISFLSGTTDAALCSDDQLGQVTVDVFQADPGHVWHVERSDETGLPVWTVTPDKGNANLFDAGGAGGGGILILRFSGIRSDLAPGRFTPLAVQHAGLAGYNDGHHALLLEKAKPVPFVRSFKATSAEGPVDSGDTVLYGPLSLEWDVFATQYCFLQQQNEPSNPTRFAPIDGTRVEADEPTVGYELRAGADDHDASAATLEFRVAPAVADMAASPAAAPAGFPITLTWTCRSGRSCSLYAGQTLIADQLPLNGSRTVTITDTTAFSVVCHGVQDAQVSATVTLLSIEIRAIAIHHDDAHPDCFLDWDATSVQPSACTVYNPYFALISREARGHIRLTVNPDIWDDFFQKPFEIWTDGPYGKISAKAYPKRPDPDP